MRVEDFDYDLPEALIAQEPSPERTGSRLMILDRKTQEIHHRMFPDLLEYLHPGDLLVFNDTKVIPARLWARKEKTGGKVEILLVNQVNYNTWEALAKPGRRVQPGCKLIFGDGMLRGEVIGRTAEGTRIIRFETDNFMEDLIKIGEVPLPPYIKKPIQDLGRYQTIYAKYEGSSAAPTAGLHFTEKIFEKLRQKGIEWTYITLHIGPGTFRPVRTEHIEDHNMHAEFYRVSEENFARILDARNRGKRIIPVGTTATRTLESIAECLKPDSGCQTNEVESTVPANQETIARINSYRKGLITTPACPSQPQIDGLHTTSTSHSFQTLSSNIQSLDTNLQITPPAKVFRPPVLEGWTSIFIYPGFEFQLTDALITNFHLPRSTLIMLVCALAGREFIMRAYKEAVDQKYRFFSFGDCMLII